MKPVKCAIALMVCAVAPLAAQVPPAQLPGAKPGAPAAPAAAPRQINLPGVSPAGNAIINKYGARPDPMLQQLIGQLKAVSAQLALTAQAPTIDVDKLAALLKQREGIQAQLGTHNDDRLIGALRALPAADRGPFLADLNNAGQRAAAGH